MFSTLFFFGLAILVVVAWLTLRNRDERRPETTTPRRSTKARSRRKAQRAQSRRDRRKRH